MFPDLDLHTDLITLNPSLPLHPYRWHFTGYQIPKFPNGKEKGLREFSISDRDHLRTAISDGTLVAVRPIESLDVDSLEINHLLEQLAEKNALIVRYEEAIAKVDDDIAAKRH